MAARFTKNVAQHTREKIQTTQIVNRLYNHILGKLELSATQVKAADILLKKTMPDLSAIDINAIVENITDASKLSDSELTNIATSGSDRAIEQTESQDKLH